MVIVDPISYADFKADCKLYGICAFSNTDPTPSGYNVWVDSGDWPIRIPPSLMEHRQGCALGLIYFEWLQRASEHHWTTNQIAI